MSGLKRQVGLLTAIFIIVADVIGTGIFVTTGGTLQITRSAPVALGLWGIGGIMMITGSLCYAELASYWPENGGEYVYLKNIFGKLPAFLTGWVSVFIGFSASASLSAMSLIIYLNAFFTGGALANPGTQKALASLLIVFFGVVHIIGVRRGSVLQNALTALKLLIVFGLIAGGIVYLGSAGVGRLAATYTPAQAGSAAGSPTGFSFMSWGMALLFITFAYSGWNGATYIAGEMVEPRKNLPRALFWGAAIITVLYVLLNVIFLAAVPGEELMKPDAMAIGSLAAHSIFANTGLPFSVSDAFTISIAVILLSSVSVQMMVGPRVAHAMASDRMLFHSFARIHPRFGTPALAILIQMIVAIVYVYLGMNNVFALLQYMGFSLSIFPLLSVIGLLVVRFRRQGTGEGYRSPLFPAAPVIFILLTLSMIIVSLVDSWHGCKRIPFCIGGTTLFSIPATVFAIAVLAAGIPAYYIWQWFVMRSPRESVGDEHISG